MLILNNAFTYSEGLQGQDKKNKIIKHLVKGTRQKGR